MTGVVAVLRRGIDAADGSGRALHAGVCALGWPEDPMGQLWRACDLLREHRGDSHMAVWVASNLSPTRGQRTHRALVGDAVGAYTAMLRGWSEADIGGDFEETVQALDRWSATIAASGAFPPGTRPPG